jgi:hypothetical protein
MPSVTAAPGAGTKAAPIAIKSKIPMGSQDGFCCVMWFFNLRIYVWNCLQKNLLVIRKY